MIKRFLIELYQKPLEASQVLCSLQMCTASKYLFGADNIHQKALYVKS